MITNFAFIFMVSFLSTGYISVSKANTPCPLRFPYAYNGGRHCCKYEEEKSGYEYRGTNPIYEDEYCDGSVLSLDSKCCKDDQFNNCPGVTCETASFENDPCSEEFPYAYYHGLYCCMTSKEKVTFEHRAAGTTCQNNTLSLTSECCYNNEYTECVNPPCVTMDYWSLTWNAEGNDNENDPNFSRKLRLSSAGSVTLGKGYDMLYIGDNVIESDLTSAGVSPTDATTISVAAYLDGQDAQTFVANNQGILITHKQQWELFKLLRDNSVSSISHILNGGTPVVSDFEALHYSIKGLLLDLSITGVYRPPLSDTIQQWVANNDVSALSNYVGDRSNWPNVPQERFELRKAYMEKAVPQS